MGYLIDCVVSARLTFLVIDERPLTSIDQALDDFMPTVRFGRRADRQATVLTGSFLILNLPSPLQTSSGS